MSKKYKKIDTENKCAYCNNPASNSEHVFPKSLGGQDVYMDCVCDECNNKFSVLERELFQKSLVGLMKSSEGIEGYTKNKKRPAPLKYPEIFQVDSNNKIVYEIGIYNGWKPYMRPQFILKNKQIFAEAPTNEEFMGFVSAFNEWRKNVLVMVVKFPSKKGEDYGAVKFILDNGKVDKEEIKLEKVKKEIIHYSLMKGNEDFEEYFEARLFFDDNKKLVVRSRSDKEGIDFMSELLNYCSQKSPTFKSFPYKNINQIIKVSMQFNIVKSQQALVKIGLNCLMYTYPVTKYNPLLQPAKDYILRAKEINSTVDKKNDLVDFENTHNVLFVQLIEGLVVRVSLFGGHLVYSFLINSLELLEKEGDFSIFEVNYNTSRQSHFLINEYIKSKWMNNN